MPSDTINIPLQVHGISRLVIAKKQSFDADGDCPSFDCVEVQCYDKDGKIQCVGFYGRPGMTVEVQEHDDV